MTKRAGGKGPGLEVIMLRAKNIWVVGGDPRQAALAELLADDGHSVHTYAGRRCWMGRGPARWCAPGWWEMI